MGFLAVFWPIRSQRGEAHGVARALRPRALRVLLFPPRVQKPSCHLLFNGYCALVLCVCFPALGQQGGRALAERHLPVAPLSAAILQLNWECQFQFAGYFVALDKGYYRDVGLDVTILEGGPGMSPVDSVLAGDAHFGVARSGLLFQRIRGRPVVVLAAIFQHSPVVMITKASSGIATPQDMVGRRVMLLEGDNSAEYVAMLRSEGISLDDITMVPSSSGLDDFIKGKMDVLTGYVTNEPHCLEKRGISISMIRPQNYGIDFYGDCLFTSQHIIDQNPHRVSAFRLASLRGWEYAMAHSTEVIDDILPRYGVRKDRDLLLHEAEEMRDLIHPGTVIMGHMNPGRWQSMAETYARLGMMRSDFSIEGFIYDSNLSPDYRWLRWLTFAAFLLLIGGILCMVWDIQMRRTFSRRIAALSQNEEHFKELAELLPEAAWELDLRGNITFGNGAALRQFGYSPHDLVKGLTYLDLVVPGDRPKAQSDLARAIGGERIGLTEYEAVRKDGSTFPILFRARAVRRGKVTIGFRGVVMDITERRRAERDRLELERQMQYAQKLESLRVMASGIAHDFNNILMGMLANTDLLLADLPSDSLARDCAQQIGESVHRAADLAKQMLAYSGGGHLSTAQVDLSALIQEIADSLSATVPPSIQLDLQLAHVLPLIEADGEQVQHVVIDLVANAVEAIGDADGRITIRTGARTCDRSFLAATHVDDRLACGTYVFVDVVDTGCGIGEVEIKRVFEPFYTTKFTGRGLGLAAVLGIVRRHSGAIKVHSRVGEGTTFTALFPACQEENNGGDEDL